MSGKKPKGSSRPSERGNGPVERRGYEHIQAPLPAQQPDKPLTGGYEHVTPPKPPPKKPTGDSGGGRKTD